jgi:putative transposase
MNKYKSSSHSKFNISYHIVWVPKYRRHIIFDEVEERLKEILKLKIVEIGLELGALECMTDHVHLFIKSDTKTSVSSIVKQLKGYTSRVLRTEFEHLNKYSHLWAAGYFCESIGNITESTVIKYIQNQKNT